MMGRQEFSQDQLFYAFDLDAVVPDDHLLRGIDQFLDLSAQRDHLKPFYSQMGRPSVDPELLIRMPIVGYAFGIRSERRLCEDVLATDARADQPTRQDPRRSPGLSSTLYKVGCAIVPKGLSAVP